MVRKSKKRGQDADSGVQGVSRGLTPVPDIEPPGEMPAPPEPEPAPTPAATSNVVPFPVRESKVTVDVFVRAKGPIYEAFASVEKLNHQTRRMSLAVWAQEFEKFITAPRGGR